MKTAFSKVSSCQKWTYLRNQPNYWPQLLYFRILLVICPCLLSPLLYLLDQMTFGSGSSRARCNVLAQISPLLLAVTWFLSAPCWEKTCHSNPSTDLWQNLLRERLRTALIKPLTRPQGPSRWAFQCRCLLNLRTSSAFGSFKLDTHTKDL